MSLLDDFNYKIDPKFIAQKPLEQRDSSRLMILKGNEIKHAIFNEIIYELVEDSLIILNDSKVIPAKFTGSKTSESGGKVKVTLTRKVAEKQWECIVEGNRLHESLIIKFYPGNFEGKLVKWIKEGIYIIEINSDKSIETLMNKHGMIPLPHYIKSRPPNISRYQTVYARNNGSIAAPTAGLHFTPELMNALKKKNISFEFITLHVGLGSILPVKNEDLTKQGGYPEFYEISEKSANKINQKYENGSDIVVVGTTCLKALESASNNKGKILPKKEISDIFIHPNYYFKFKFQKFLTNFHLPQAPPFILTASLVGLEKLKNAYEIAKQNNYRFYSFGDAMLIIL